MHTLPHDVNIIISNNLSGKDVISFIKTCKNINRIKNKILYDIRVPVDSIKRLSYFNNFTNVVANNTVAVLPTLVTHLTFDDYFNELMPPNFVPRTVTHLTFGRDFNVSIRGCVPDSVTHLVFGFYFNKPFDLPDSVVDLTLGRCFDLIIMDLPKSVKTIRVNHLRSIIVAKEVKSQVQLIRIPSL